MFSEETVIKVATVIDQEINRLHLDHQPGRWNALAGQWLVYGFERYFGFGGAVELEAIVERAWRRGTPIKPVVEAWLYEQT